MKLQNLAGAGNLHVHSLPQQFPTNESESVCHPGSGESKGSGRCKAPVEREELLGHGRETEPFSALARPAPHLASDGTFQAGELARCSARVCALSRPTMTR